jgi:hypothetical protein
METPMDDRAERHPIGPPAPRGPGGPAQASPLAHHRDPSLPEPATPAGDSESGKPNDGAGKNKGREQIEWVRAMDVLTGRGGRQAGRAAPKLEAGVRRARAGMGRLNPISRRAIARRSAPTTQSPPSPPGAGSGRQDRDQGLWL